MATNTTTPFESFTKTQQDMLNSWVGASREILEESYKGFAETTKASSEMVLESLRSQQGLWQDAFTNTDPAEALRKSPELFQKWLGLQTEFIQKWVNFYEEETGKKFGMGQENGAKFSTSFKEAYTEWEKLLTDAYKTLSGSGLPELDERIKDLPGMSSFMDAYESIFEYWKPLLEKGIMKGTITRENFDKVFPVEAFTKNIDAMMGLNSLENIHKSAEMFDKFLTSYQEQIKNLQASSSKVPDQYTDALAGTYKGTQLEPLYDIYAEFMGSFGELKPTIGNFDYEGRTKKLNEASLKARELYMAYLEKSINFNNKVYASAKAGMTDTMELFWELYQKEGVQPSYDEFLTGWLRITKTNMSEILKSAELTALKKDLSEASAKIQKMTSDLMADLTKVPAASKAKK